MDLLIPLLGGALLVAFTGVMTWINKTQFDALRSEMHRGFDQVSGGFEEVKRRFEQVDRRFDQIAAEITSLRSDLTQVALAVGARRPQTG